MIEGGSVSRGVQPMQKLQSGSKARLVRYAQRFAENDIDFVSAPPT